MQHGAITDRLRVLRRDYHRMAGPLLLLLGVGIGGSPLLAWTAGVLLVLLTANWLVGRWRPWR